MCKPRLPFRSGVGFLSLAPVVALLMLSAPALAQPAPTCPANSMFIQEPYEPALEWVALSSDVWPDTRWYERYSVSADVCDVHWWGILQIHDTGVECYENPIEFEIAFWEDVGGMPAPAPACTYRYPVLGEPTGYLYDGLMLYEYGVDLQPCCPQTDGWVSIQAICFCDPDCWFWWMGSTDGDQFSWYEQPAGAGPSEFDPSICLTHETVQPERMILDGPFGPVQPIASPVGPWHQLWPTYCADWECIDWSENGNGRLDVCDYVLLQEPPARDPTWWHVENVTVTAFFDWTDPPLPDDPPILEWVGPLPQDMVDFVPLGLWHEVWPNYCTAWECIDWEDNGNGILDPCDVLVFGDPGGPQIRMHVSLLATDIEVKREDPVQPPQKTLDNPNLDPFLPIPDPTGQWHELWPTWCRMWDVTDWIDNHNGVLDACDYILLEDQVQAPAWWHVERVTVTIALEDDPPTLPATYLDWVGPSISDPFNPVGPWHEVSPNYCGSWECVGWDDANGSGVFDPCDFLDFIDPDGNDVRLHVFEVATDIDIVREDPPDPDHKWLDNPDLSPFEPVRDPLGSWHELWPVYCWWWDVVDWIDNGNFYLDECDYIQMGKGTLEPEWWHVETVTVTVEVIPDVPQYPPMYLDYVGPSPVDPFDPIGPWHEVWPNFCAPWWCLEWHDENHNGVVDEGDWLCFEDPANPPEMVCTQVVTVATDIEIVRQDPPRMWLDGPPAVPPYEPIPDPSGLWHELWPEFCGWTSCFDWFDNGNDYLDECDYVLLGIPPVGAWWHVETVTLTVEFDQIEGPYIPPIYMDWMGPVPPDPMWPIGPWHEVYPNFCKPWWAAEWHDDNGTGVVDECDWICFEDPDNPPQLICMHVANVAWDIEVLQRPHPCPCDCEFPRDGTVDVGDFLKLLAQWGEPGSCDCESPPDGVVDVGDFLAILATWGPCP